MKKITFTLLLTLISIVSKAQNLSMSELLSLLGKDVSYVEEFLSEKGWEFRKIHTFPESHNIALISFDYGRAIYDSNRAESFLDCSFSPSSLTVVFLSIQVNNNEDYLEYMKAIKRYGCKLISSSYTDEGLMKIYKGNTKMFGITTATTKDKDDPDKIINYWNFVIMSNKTYYEYYSSPEEQEYEE